MKVICPNKISSLSASSNDSDYPVDNLYDDFTTSLWKAESNVATLHIQVLATSNAIAVVNTNATSIEIIKSVASGVQWASRIQWGSNVNWQIADGGVLSDSYTPGARAQWINYTQTNNPTDIDLVFTSPGGTVVEAGIVRAGYAYSFNSPRVGLAEDRKSTSIINPLPYGGAYIKNKQQNIRKFQLSTYATRDNDFYEFLYDVGLEAEGKPLAWSLTDTLTNQDWTLFASLDGINGAHPYPVYSSISATLLEAV